MKLQISSGQGPAECELAVGKFALVLCEEFNNTAVKQKTSGINESCYKSIIIESECDLSFLDGTVKWICQSPFRPNHKRKNWFIDVSPITSLENIDFDDEKIRFDTFRSGGKGGQHVNKVETGVRATYLLLNISAVSTDERSQYMNKKRALERLKKLVAEQETDAKRVTERSNWMEHTRLIRGNALRVYEGMSFRRI